MNGVSLLNENWQVILSLFPKNWRELAKETGAMTRTLRSFSSEDAVIRTLLIHVAQGYSLRETVVKAKAAGIANVSDVALLKRLRVSEEWLKALCESLFNERSVGTLQAENGITMRLVDGTNVKEPGKTGSLWRIHYSLRLPDLNYDYFKLTSTKGENTGETYRQFPISKNHCIIGDRGYSTAQGIEHIHNAKAFSLVRVNTQALNFFSKDGEKADLLSNIAPLDNALQIKEWTTYVRKKDKSLIEGRVCVLRKTEYAIEQAIKKLKQTASRKKNILKPSTLEYAKYVIVFTTLPSEYYSASSVLEWYRLRWQIELIFKRLKSLAGLGHLPKHDASSSRAWLYGKLLVGLLVEKLITQARVISPWGYSLGF